MTRTLVTGAAGFIGSHLVAALLDKGEDVVGLDNLSNCAENSLTFLDDHPNKDQFTFIEGDIRNLSDCHLACKGVDYVLHQAALGSVPRSMAEPALFHDNNVNGTFNILLAARDAKVKRFCSASSSSVYGDTPILPKVETMDLNPMSPYAVTKVVGEAYCRLFFDVYGLETISFRYFNVFGPRQNPNSQYAAAIPKFVDAYMSGSVPTIHGDGEQTRDFTYIDNVVNTNLDARYAPKEACGLAYNVGCGDRISINMLVSEIKKAMNVDGDAIYSESRAGDVRDSLADIGLLRSHITQQRFVSLSEGLKTTVDWYQT